MAKINTSIDLTEKNLNQAILKNKKSVKEVDTDVREQLKTFVDNSMDAINDQISDMQLTINKNIEKMNNLKHAQNQGKNIAICRKCLFYEALLLFFLLLT